MYPHLIFFRPAKALLLSLSLLASVQVSGQLANFSSQYHMTNASGVTAETQINNITKTLNNKLLTAGYVETPTGEVGGAYPQYLSRYNDMRLLQTDLDGNVIFNRIVSSEYDDRAFESVRTNLGEMMVVGHSGQAHTPPSRQSKGLAPNVNNAAVSILTINSVGTVVSQNLYDLNGFDDHAYSVVRKSNDYYYVLGRSYRNPYDKYVITFMNVDADGVMRNASIIHDNYASHLLPKKMIRTNDGGYLIAAVKEDDNTNSIHCPDPFTWLIEGDGIYLIKLDVNENIVYSRFVRPNAAGSYLVGVKDMVEDAYGNVVIVGTSSEGDYAMKMNAAGTITIAKRFLYGGGRMSITPYCVIRNGSGFVVSGFTPSTGVPRVILDANLNVISASRHHFGEEIHSMENVSGGLQYLAGIQFSSLILKWPSGNAICTEFPELVEVENLPIIQALHELQKASTPFTKLDARPDTLWPTTRNNNCITMSKTAVAAALDADPQTTVSPNPAHDRVQLSIAGEGAAQVEVYDLQGRLIDARTLTCGQHSMSVETLQNGIYLVSIRTQSGSSTHRISIQH